MATEYMTRDEVKAFGDKLNAFGQGLSPKEQRLLAVILLQAAAGAAEVEGHDYPTIEDRGAVDFAGLVRGILEPEEAAI